MDLQIVNNFHKKIESENVEIVERKGIGHPDSLADLVAETFSNKYSQYCLKEFGVVLNHWVDKIVLSGGMAQVSFGKSKIVKPIAAYLFGKVTPGIGKKSIDVIKIFKESVSDVFISVFKDNNILKNINYIVDTNNGIGLDHPKEFYAPWRVPISLDTPSTL